MKYLTNFNTLLEYEDALILDIPNTSYIVEDKVVKYSELPVMPNKLILYTSNNDQTINPHRADFGANLIENTYTKGQGMMLFDGDVTSIGNNVFSDCPSLTAITIPNSVSSIGNYTFSNCTALTSVTIPSSTRSIGKGAFAGCTSLTSIAIPRGVTSIEYGVFNYCTSLTSITIPNSVTSIGMFAFATCSSLSSITIPNNVTSIGDAAFSSCSSLTSITCEATTPPTLGSSSNLSSVITVYVPAESVELYKSATNWSYYADKIQPIQ